MKKYKLRITETSKWTILARFNLKDFGFITRFLYTCIERQCDPYRTTEDENTVVFSIQCPTEPKVFIQKLINEQFNPAVIDIKWN